LRARDQARTENITWSGGNQLTFTYNPLIPYSGLTLMVPSSVNGNPLQSLTLGGSPVSYTSETVKGYGYVLFNAAPGTYTALYGADTTPPNISIRTATANGDGTAQISWTTNEPATSRVNFGTVPAALSQQVEDTALVTSHSVTLTGLSPNTTYYYRVTSADASANSSTDPP